MAKSWPSLPYLSSLSPGIPALHAVARCPIFSSLSYGMVLRSFSAPTAAGAAGLAAGPIASPLCRASLAVRSSKTGRALNYLVYSIPLSSSLNSLTVGFSPGHSASTFKCATIEEIEAEKSLIEKDARERMEKTIETMRSNFNVVRTGRANPSMLDAIEVEYYGTPVSLKSIAQISTSDARTLLVQPYDKSSLKAIEKAIVSSDLGITPNNNGESIRLGIPQLTSERRKELLKLVAKQAEEGKIAVRNIRRDAMKAYEKLEKEKKLSEDNVKDLSSDLQKVTDEYMKKIDSALQQKEKVLVPFCI
ncbi:Ribosome-recycling factor, chloroplastic [Apostasia shenzhenica]|uniref:Ribosome-recycling factor, chloroplastic n=1 Tax=Apostasia shenzhenica TaxID=1088818 RepID=A0A2I0APN6_9ASPA|nr:Ribosome-recycling factor, chloroplastic [Apostasia shenzhenica]